MAEYFYQSSWDCWVELINSEFREAQNQHTAETSALSQFQNMHIQVEL